MFEILDGGNKELVELVLEIGEEEDNRLALDLICQQQAGTGLDL